MKILNKNKCASKEMIKKVKEYCKPFNTNNLTIVFTNIWTFRGWKSKKTYSYPKKYVGYYKDKKTQYSYSSLNQFGFREILLPFIVIRIDEQTKMNWYETFLHEFGHYVDFKTNNAITHTKRQKEKFAREYAICGCKQQNSILELSKSQEDTKGEVGLKNSFESSPSSILNKRG